MRFLIFSDLHLHNFQAFARPVGGGLNSRAVECLRVLEEIGKLAKKKKVAATLFCGDFFHTRSYVYTSLVLAARKVLDDWPGLCLAIGGDHDASTNEPESPSAIDIFSSEKFKVLGPSNAQGFSDPSDKVEVAGYSHGVPFPFPGVPSTLKGAKRIVLLHTTLLGTKISPYWASKTGLEIEDLERWLNENRIDYCFIGNIHFRQRLSEHLWYVGNCIPWNFGEDQEKGVLLLDTQEDTIDFLPIESPRFVTVSTIAETKQDGNYYRVDPKSREDYLEAKSAKASNTLVLPVPEMKEARVDVGLDCSTREALEAYLDFRGVEGRRRKRLLKLALEFIDA